MTNQPIEERIDARVRRRRTQREQEEAAPLAAALALLKPEADLGRAALLGYDAFGTAHLDRLTQHAKWLSELEYDPDGIRPELDRAKACLGSLLAPLRDNPPLIRRTLDEIDRLTPMSLQDPRLVGRLRGRLLQTATTADTLEGNLEVFERAWADLDRKLASEERRTRRPRVFQLTADPETEPPASPARAQGAVTHGEGA